MEPPLTSFIIPHRGRCDLLLSTLTSISCLVLDRHRIEIILVTQDTELDGIDLARRVSQRSGHLVEYNNMNGQESGLQASTRAAEVKPLVIIKVERSKTISTLRNIGASYSAGEYLAFLDADIKLSANWLSAMHEALISRRERVIVSAMQADSGVANTLEQVRVCLSNLRVDTTLEFLPGRNLFLERKTFTELEGFPEHLSTCEDYWFTNKASQIGELYYSSSAVYVHLGEDKSFLEMARKEVWRGQSNLYSVGGRRVGLRESASFIAPLWVLFAMIAIVPATMVLGRPAAMVAALAIALPVGLYSWRLLHGTTQRLSVGAVLGFYVLYLPARGLGMLKGLAKTLANSVSRGVLVDKRADG